MSTSAAPRRHQSAPRRRPFALSCFFSQVQFAPCDEKPGLPSPLAIFTTERCVDSRMGLTPADPLVSRYADACFCIRLIQNVRVIDSAARVYSSGVTFVRKSPRVAEITPLPHHSSWRGCRAPPCSYRPRCLVSKHVVTVGTGCGKAGTTTPSPALMPHAVFPCGWHSAHFFLSKRIRQISPTRPHYSTRRQGRSLLRRAPTCHPPRDPFLEFACWVCSPTFRLGACYHTPHAPHYS